jgi:hypothetical protein
MGIIPEIHGPIRKSAVSGRIGPMEENESLYHSRAGKIRFFLKPMCFFQRGVRPFVFA